MTNDRKLLVILTRCFACLQNGTEIENVRRLWDLMLKVFMPELCDLMLKVFMPARKDTKSLEKLKKSTKWRQGRSFGGNESA